MPKRVFKTNIEVNRTRINQVVIDSHYELKHSESISDSIILELVCLLDGGDFDPESVSPDFEYYMTDNLILRSKKYRLIWLIEKGSLYIGVINAYRRKS